MFKKKVVIRNDLFEKLKVYKEKLGYSTIDEFVNHIIEKEVKKIEEASDSKDAIKQLKGLGYI